MTSRAGRTGKGGGRKGGSKGQVSKTLCVPLLSSAEAEALTVRMEDADACLNQVLAEHGCAIVTGVVDPVECQHLEGLFVRDLLDLVDLPATQNAGRAVQHAVEQVAQGAGAWPLTSLELLGEKDRCQLRGLPHGRFAWACRLHSSVRRCYEIIHGTEELVSSCDNPFFAPSGQQERHENPAWPHVDHNRHDKRFFDDQGLAIGDWEVFQGILYVWSSEESHASTTVVLPGSHLDEYAALMADPSMQKRGLKGDHFSMLGALSAAELKFALQERFQSDARRVTVPRGGLFLWSSRTLHQGWSGGPRLAQPVCWEPLGRRNELAYSRKLMMAALGLPSTHWGSLGIRHYLVPLEQCTPSAASCNASQVLLPVKAAIRLASLHEAVDQEDLWRKLQSCNWDVQLPDDLKEFLEACLQESVLAAL